MVKAENAFHTVQHPCTTSECHLHVPSVLFHRLCHIPSHLPDYFPDVSTCLLQDGWINTADTRKRFSFYFCNKAVGDSTLPAIQAHSRAPSGMQPATWPAHLARLSLCNTAAEKFIHTVLLCHPPCAQEYTWPTHQGAHCGEWRHPYNCNCITYWIVVREDQSMAIINMYKKFCEFWTCGFWDMWADRHAYRHTDMLIAI